MNSENSTRFYVAISKVEGTGPHITKDLLNEIKIALRHIYAHRIKVLIQDDNILQITYMEPK